MAPIVYFSVLLLMLAASDAAAQTTREQIARGKYVFGAAAEIGRASCRERVLTGV